MTVKIAENKKATFMYDSVTICSDLKTTAHMHILQFVQI